MNSHSASEIQMRALLLSRKKLLSVSYIEVLRSRWSQIAAAHCCSVWGTRAFL